MKPPEFVDPDTIPRGAESRAKKKPSKDQPGFFMFDRLLAAPDKILSSRPERANEHPVPIVLGQSKNFLKTLEKIGGREFVALMKRLGTERPKAGAGGIQPGWVNFRSDVCIIAGVHLFFVARFVLAQVKLERPRLGLARIGADAGDLEQTEFVHPSGQSHWHPVVFSTSSGKSGGALERRKPMKVALVPCHQGTRLVLVASGRVIRLKPDWTVHAEFEPEFSNPKLFFGSRAPGQNTHQGGPDVVPSGMADDLQNRLRGLREPRSAATGVTQ